MSEQPSRQLPIPNTKRGMNSFFQGVKREMRKVSWPTYKETNRLFGVVLAVCFLLAGVMTVLGFAFDAIIGILVKRGGA